MKKVGPVAIKHRKHGIQCMAHHFFKVDSPLDRLVDLIHAFKKVELVKLAFSGLFTSL